MRAHEASRMLRFTLYDLAPARPIPRESMIRLSLPGLRASSLQTSSGHTSALMFEPSTDADADADAHHPMGPLALMTSGVKWAPATLS